MGNTDMLRNAINWVGGFIRQLFIEAETDPAGATREACALAEDAAELAEASGL